MSKQSEALRLADALQAEFPGYEVSDVSAAELRRQHSRIEADEALMRQALETLQENRTDIARVESAVYMRDYYDAAITALRTRLDALPPPPVQGGEG